mmetsp:Transcript_38017/g.81207  ORF Transcript_38017/g.81207 Transcript_38017/m.81207 type:complete len:1244 (+) Transcript_38017:325-4056(+)|eukprot:CAMPEP_0172557166 /NCGR_PEP_ID=MMETSP1067-20121228/71713_1 /TAXON_ID=265564 ORGANISM="Thalassiosira punctigera, Strain Tpunct2005C2" /NCGR_SAMPLE_ID=MMETSP1067 /ASSEMBLY_ACC=CAM_ASM_000444 /LENGTH=1243 /DNA_ID=CAMNT_0013346173 /DNA_START=232 /DNA_END=3963 /DNA_ORIENTATION=-
MVSSYQQGEAAGYRDEEAEPLRPASYSPVDDRSNGSWKRWTAGAALVAFLGLAGRAFSGNSSPASVADGANLLGKKHHKSKAGKDKHVMTEAEKNAQLFDESRRYIFHDFDARSAVSNFLPGVAGIFGKPVWAFYVNRGQGLASFGIASKDYPLLEFSSANKAYQQTPYVGFRTFLEGTRGGHHGKEDGTSFLVEPFSPANSKVAGLDDDGTKPTRTMYVGTGEMEIVEEDDVHGVTTSVTYFGLPEADVAALVRRTTITNTGDDALTLSALDGLAKMEPTGGKLQWGLKNMGRTLEGWMGVYHADETLSLPFFRMSTEPSDTASVKIEKEGHYCIASVDGREGLLPIVYDTEKVFGFSSTLQEPNGVIASSIADVVSNPQYGDAKTSSAFAALQKVTLAPGESVTINSYYGKASHIEDLPGIAEEVTAPGFTENKLERARDLMSQLTSSVETHTANHLFDGAIKQNYLDNSLRGGMPVILGELDEKARSSNADEDPRLKVYHVFSRIHGDLERDYNDFNIDPTFFSQGPGNYRDVAQNRRNDVVFSPRIGAFVVKQFLSFIQADGYEPLTVEAVAYLVQDPNQAARVAGRIAKEPKSAQIITEIIRGGIFRPGQLFTLFEQIGVNLKVSNQVAIDEIMAISHETPMAVYGSGYWADHWEYYLDLIEAYTSIYPDGEESLMYDTELPYFFSTASVKPRSEKYVVDYTFDGKSKHILQLDATEFDMDKVKEQAAFRNQTTGLIANEANWQRTGKAGKGRAFKSPAITKLFLLGAIKYATRDAYGMGIEYEGGRPGWNDAMNGLAGMVGSGMPETFELSELLKYVNSVVAKYQRPIIIPAELGVMVDTINDALAELMESGYEDTEMLSEDVPEELFKYWDAVAAARESYRSTVSNYFSGNTVTISAEDAIEMLTNWYDQVQIGVGRAMTIGSRGIDDDGTSGVPPSYFSYDVTTWKLNGKKNDKGLPMANPKSMSVGVFPLFLEGPTRYMKLIKDDDEKMLEMYDKVLNSGLRDDELKMYFLSADLTGQSYDMGRMMAFAAGWLENQSIWMHMSYKYYLQLLRGKLFDQFFAEMKGGGMLPFMDPDVYGRSLMECSSFIASSAFKDPSVVGRGFLARLSGSTAEFLSVWKLMFMGPEPYFMNDEGEVEMQLVPALPIWLFEDLEAGAQGRRDDDGNLIVSFKLFASIMVTYHNTLGTDLFDVPPTKYVVHMEDGTSVEVDGPTVPTETAVQIRKLLGVESIDVYY